MVLGFTPCDAQASELRRVELLALVEPERRHLRRDVRSSIARGEWTRRLGAALVRAGERLRGAAAPASRASRRPMRRLPDRL